jgi:hypothetical protein
MSDNFATDRLPRRDMEKYQVLYNLSKDAFAEELARFNVIDEKAGKYISVVTLLLGVYGFYAQWIIERLIPPSGILQWILILLGGIILLGLVSTWFTIFSVLRRHRLQKIPLDSSVIEFFEKNELLDIYHALSRGMKDAIEKNRTINEDKMKRLVLGYRMISVTLIFLVLFGLLFGYDAWHNPPLKRNATMSEKNTESQDAAGPSPIDQRDQVVPKQGEQPRRTEPNRNLIAPTFQEVSQSEGRSPRKHCDGFAPEPEPVDLNIVNLTE